MVGLMLHSEGQCQRVTSYGCDGECPSSRESSVYTTNHMCRGGGRGGGGLPLTTTIVYSQSRLGSSSRWVRPRNTLSLGASQSSRRI